MLPDSVLISNVKTQHCNQSLKELIQRHSGICTNIINKYTSEMQNSGLHVSDIFSEKDLIIYNAALTYDEAKKTKFVTWVGNKCKYYCKTLATRTPLKEFAVSNEELNYHLDKKALEDDNIKSKVPKEEILDAIYSLEDERIREIFVARYLTEPPVPYKQLAAKLGITTAWIFELKKKGAKQLKEKLKYE